MNTDHFFNKIRTYTRLGADAEHAWLSLLKERKYQKGENFISIGQIPVKACFVVKGLFSQHFITDKGDTIIKYFFAEGSIAGSIPATLSRSESIFAITALEDSTVIEYNFHEFKKLVAAFRDIAEFYITYMERHWVIDKEPMRLLSGTTRQKTMYEELVKKDPALVKRLKKQHIAAYLGITPTQLSRIIGTVE